MIKNYLLLVARDSLERRESVDDFGNVFSFVQINSGENIHFLNSEFLHGFDRLSDELHLLERQTRSLGGYFHHSRLERVAELSKNKTIVQAFFQAARSNRHTRLGLDELKNLMLQSRIKLARQLGSNFSLV